MRHYRAQNKRSVLVCDRLFVDGREVRAEEIDVSQKQRLSREPHTGRAGGERGSAQQSQRRWAAYRPQLGHDGHRNPEMCPNPLNSRGVAVALSILA
ncbi:hypothetical protein DPMN_025941 [Dreissena polymorpha]|uniref:Uncharacterized protein n=1 Tax=Dreissena polymorpha TaxID=45954 RepID=A0A9D4RE38_DREPO|nr:hypothetical protein DPMN_025941 [Dreissena polymorpha]